MVTSAAPAGGETTFESKGPGNFESHKKTEVAKKDPVAATAPTEDTTTTPAAPAAAPETETKKEPGEPGYVDADGISVGVRVRLEGINSKPEYNGTMATVAAWDKKNERWKVKLDVDGETKAMKNKNLIVVKDGSDGANAPPAS